MELPREFRVPRLIIAANALVALACFAIAIFAFFSNQPGAIAGGTMVGLGVGAFAVSLMTRRVTLSESALCVSSISERLEYPRGQVLDTRWEEGKPLSVELAGTGWVNLPYLADESPVLHVFLRRWIAAGKSVPGSNAEA